MNRQKWIEAMKDYYGEDVHRIDHAMDVLGYAEEIASKECQSHEAKIVTAAAVFHDIGIPEAVRKHGSGAAPYQEIEGAPIAREILTDLNEDEALIGRVEYIVGHHHTKDKIDGLDFQVIWEADLLVNLRGQKVLADRAKLQTVIENNFKTATGRALATEIYLK